MQPRLALDIGWRDLASVWAPTRGGPAAIPGVAALSVRTAFDALLSELALPAGAEVAMSAINIEGMADIVRAHGLAVRPVDIDPATLAPTPRQIAAALGPRTGLVLVAHLYGTRNPLTALAKACRAGGVLLVEDCAQAFAGELALSPGADVALYSFGPIKTATALGGAVALVRDPALAGRLAARLAALPRLGDGWFLRRAAKYAVLKALNAPLPYGALNAAIRLAGRDPDAVIGSLARGFGGGELIARIRHAPPPRLLRLLARRLAQAAPPAARQARAAALLAAVRARAPGSAAAVSTWWVTPIESRDPDRLIAALRRGGFDATRGATSLRALPGAPAAERLIRSVVYLPATPHLTPGAARRLAAIVRAVEGAHPAELELAA